MDTPPPTTRDRVRDRFPAVLLTVLSIIQALALEVLWSNLSEHPHLWDHGLGALIGWLQVLATFQGIMLVWVFYTSLVMRIVWVPSIRDSLLPFILGIAEFVLADMLQPEFRHLWLYVIAGVFALSSWTSTSTFKLARLEPENRAFYAGFKEYSTNSYTIPATFVCTLLLLGLVIQIWGPEGWGALGCMVMVNVLLVAQLLIIRYYWWRSLADNDPATAEASAPGDVD
jgi:hypothetical protein